MSEHSTANPQTGMDRFFSAMRGIGIRRRTDDKWLAGVSSGLADRLGVDPVIARAGFVLLTLLGGAGITIYLVAWALLPNDRDEIVAQRALRDGDGGSIVVVVFAALGLFGGSAFGGPWWADHSAWGFPWGLALTGLLIWWLVKRSDNRQRPAPGMEAGPRVSTYQSGAGVAAQTQVLPQTQQGPRTQQGPQQQGPYQQSGWQSPPFSTGRPVQPHQPVPTRLRRQSGGPLLAPLAIGLALATYGSLIWAGNAFSWQGSHAAVALAGSLAAVGVLMVAVGAGGWRAGFLTFLAVILAINAWTAAVVPAGIHANGRIGDATWAPTSVTTGAVYHVGVGSGVLDLSQLPSQPPTQPLRQAASAATPAPTIGVSVGIGDLKVVVPPGLTVKVVGHVSLGEIILPTDTSGNHQGGSDVSRSTVIGDPPTDVVVNAAVGLGQLTVVKE